ncbi:MAG: hypothetical protein M5U26_21800 [Planctomycetota bacterium]|nr:hypothetical protein [Planctomycetota bacterium]
MSQYVLKILLDFDARDDLEARRKAAALIQQAGPALETVREIVLHDQNDRKSIRMTAGGEFEGEWNRGGPGKPPGPSSS